MIFSNHSQNFAYEILKLHIHYKFKCIFIPQNWKFKAYIVKLYAYFSKHSPYRPVDRNFQGISWGYTSEGAGAGVLGARAPPFEIKDSDSGPQTPRLAQWQFLAKELKGFTIFYLKG